MPAPLEAPLAAPGTAPDTATQAFPAEFPEFPTARATQRLSLDRFLDVQVEVTVEIGRVTTTLGELLNLGTGAVFELDREVTAPVDIVAQGARIGRGEIIVVDDRFAVRITQIESQEGADK